jgi:hypothetical protein
MLETIIKKYLFEAREFKAVVKKADIRSYNDAKAAVRYMHLMLYIQFEWVKMRYRQKQK